MSDNMVLYCHNAFFDHLHIPNMTKKAFPKGCQQVPTHPENL